MKYLPSKEHDKLAWRLTLILQKFNQGERVKIKDLAEEFGVHPRTVQRDILERFSFLPLDKNSEGYALDELYLGKLSFRDIERFASIAGLKGMFPMLDAQFIRELLDARLQETFNVHAPSYEDLSHRSDDFRQLQTAISENSRVRFTYDKGNERKIVEVEPYSLINNSGIWYLAASDENKPKSYALGKLSGLQVLDEQFLPRAEIRAMLDEEDSIWLNENKTEVVLTVAREAAIYFLRRKLIAQQTIVKKLEGGGLIISGRFAHPNQILPIVRYWLPHIRIVSPAGWQESLEKEMHTYLNDRR